MDSIIINNNKHENTENKDIDVDIENSGTDQESGSVSPPVPNGPSPNVSSFLKFSIQNILQQAAATNGAAAIAAAATRRSSDLIHADMAAAVMNDFDMKRAMAGSLPFW